MKKQNKTENKLKVVEMEEIPVIDLPKVDITEYIGKKAKIAKADVVTTQYGRAIRFETEIIDTVGTEKNPIEIKASKLLGLQQDEDGRWGMGKGTKTEEFFNTWKLKTHKDMIGKIVVVQATDAKNGTQFLTFA